VEHAVRDVAPSVARGFLFADLRNYSAWVESRGDHAAASLLGAYRELVREAVAEFDGAEIKTEGPLRPPTKSAQRVFFVRGAPSS
jgi:class 3 adenylate cyclase